MSTASPSNAPSAAAAAGSAPPAAGVGGRDDRALRRAALRAAAEAKAEQSRPRMWRNIRADIRRHDGRILTRSVLGLAVFRFGAWALTRGPVVRAVALRVYGVLERFMRWATGLHMHCTALVGEDLHLIHVEGPISIHPDVVMGDRVGIMHNVTIGLAPDQDGAPILGTNVFIGTGAAILGPVVVGDGARIAANSLVLQDVPPNCLAIGVPARMVPRIAVGAAAANGNPASPPANAP
jgi:serine O-acetyltransferase